MSQNKYRVLCGILLLLAVILSACGAPATPVAPENANVDTTTCVEVGSDNGKSFASNGLSSACVPVDTRVYTLKIHVIGNMQSNQTVNGEVSGSSFSGTGFVSGSIWTEGKGILPIEIMNLTPTFDGLENGDLIIIKTTDLKAMGLPVNAVTTFLCNKDPEALSPLYAGQQFTTDRVTYELDDCRMQSPKFEMWVPTSTPAATTPAP